jgi:hypothetical protein
MPTSASRSPWDYFRYLDHVPSAPRTAAAPANGRPSAIADLKDRRNTIIYSRSVGLMTLATAFMRQNRSKRSRYKECDQMLGACQHALVTELMAAVHE